MTTDGAVSRVRRLIDGRKVRREKFKALDADIAAGLAKLGDAQTMATESYVQALAAKVTAAQAIRADRTAGRLAIATWALVLSTLVGFFTR